MNKLQFFFISISFVLALSSCSAPRAVSLSGKVTPHKEFRAGANYSASVPTQTVSSMVSNAESVATQLIEKDTIYMDDELMRLNRSAISYSLDPLGSGFDLFIRYGYAPGFDAGYKYASGVHVLDTRYQFMGSKGSIENPGEIGLNGSIGIQYSSQKYELPFGLSKLQKLLGYEMSRKDIMIPIIFSHSFGEEEKIGSVAFGAVYNHCFIDYGFKQSKIYEVISANEVRAFQAINAKNNFASFGIFSNIKAGYKYAWVVASVAVYYQNYGKYKLINGDEITLKGFTTIPTLGVQFRIPARKK